MHQPNEWHGSASKNMDHARTMQDHAHKQNETSFQAHEQTMGDNMSSYNDVQSSLKQKVHNTYRLIDIAEASGIPGKLDLAGTKVPSRLGRSSSRQGSTNAIVHASVGEA